MVSETLKKLIDDTLGADILSDSSVMVEEAESFQRRPRVGRKKNNTLRHCCRFATRPTRQPLRGWRVGRVLGRLIRAL